MVILNIHFATFSYHARKCVVSHVVSKVLPIIALTFSLTVSGCSSGLNMGAKAQVELEETDISTVILPGDQRLSIPDFVPYEVEYDSAFGRFYNQVRKFKIDDEDKVSVLNIIEMPQMVIVDHRTIDAKTLRIETFNSPYFAWGPEYVSMNVSAEDYRLVRIPADGSAPIHSQGALDNNGYFDSLGFSPTLAAVMPLAVGTKFQLPMDQPRKNGSVVSVLMSYEVIGKEVLQLPSGISCMCWVIQENSANGSVHKYWISREAPFLFQRHRDIGGKRDFISSAIRYRQL